MILLSEIDHRRVLDGARVPLCWHITDEQIAAAEHPTDRRLLEDTRNARIEWCGDIGWRDEGTGYGTRFFHEPWGAMAIDPAHPDVARLLNRKIASLIADRPFNWCDLRIGVDGHWSIVYGVGTRYDSCGVGHLTDVPPRLANIPAARAALIRALYPKEAP